MWQEIYYDYLTKNSKGQYCGMGEKILPYSIKCKNAQTKKALEELLRKNGLKNVCGSQCRGLLVNLELKRFCSYPRPASMSCIGNHSYSEESFLSEIYYPWYLQTKYGIDGETARPLVDMYLEKYFCRCCEPGLTDGEMREEQIVMI